MQYLFSVLWGKHVSWWAMLLTHFQENTYQQCKISLLFFREKRKHPPFLSLIVLFAHLECHNLVHVKRLFQTIRTCTPKIKKRGVTNRVPMHVLRVYFIFVVTSFIWFSNLSILSVPDEGYSRNASCALN
jgi:hypothetical protein